MGKITIASQVDDDSELLERFQEFEEETGYGNRSKAVRAAIRRGLDAYDAEQQDEQQSALSVMEDWLLTVAAVLAALSIVVAVGAVLGLVPFDSGVRGGILLVTTAGVGVVAVRKGLVESIERQLGGKSVSAEAVSAEVAD